MSDIIERGRALLGLDVETGEVPPIEPTATETLLASLLALTQILIDRVDCLERAMSAPRVRTPVRDDLGRITEVRDSIEI